MIRAWFCDKFFFASVYFVQGAMGLAALAKLYFLKDEIGLTEIQFATLNALAVIPFTIKPIYGLISDFFPIFGRRRKFYLIIGSLLNVLSWIFLVTNGANFWTIFATLIINGLGLALVDVIADGMVVERSTPKNVGKLQTLCWMSFAIAALLASISGGYLLKIFTPREVFLITAILPFITLIQAIFVHDPKLDPLSHTKRPVHVFKVFFGLLGINTILGMFFFLMGKRIFPDMSAAEMLANSVMMAFLLGNLVTIFIIHRWVEKFPLKIFLGAVLFLFLWRSVPSISTNFSYFVIDKLKWNEVFLGYLGFANAAGNIIGAILYWKFFDKISLRKIFFWTITIGSLTGLLNLAFIYQPPFLDEFKFFGFPGITIFAVTTDFLNGMVFYIGFLPLFKLAAEIVPKNVEATLFALVASFMNLGLLVSTYSGAKLATLMNVGMGHYEKLPHLMILVMVIGLCLLPFIIFVPREQRLKTLLEKKNL